MLPDIRFSLPPLCNVPFYSFQVARYICVWKWVEKIKKEWMIIFIVIKSFVYKISWLWSVWYGSQTSCFQIKFVCKWNQILLLWRSKNKEKQITKKPFYFHEFGLCVKDQPQNEPVHDNIMRRTKDHWNLYIPLRSVYCLFGAETK